MLERKRCPHGYSVFKEGGARACLKCDHPPAPQPIREGAGDSFWTVHLAITPLLCSTIHVDVVISEDPLDFMARQQEKKWESTSLMMTSYRKISKELYKKHKRFNSNESYYFCLPRDLRG